MSDENHGTGDEDRFPAEDLERLYRVGEKDGDEVRVKGATLNEILSTSRYARNVWYVVTDKGVRRL